jgi:hypothetical protein
MRRGPRCLDEFPCRSCGQKLLGLTGFALYAAYAAIVRLNGRSSSADFLHDDPDAVHQISGGAAMWPESFLEPGTFFRNGSFHARSCPSVNGVSRRQRLRSPGCRATGERMHRSQLRHCSGRIRHSGRTVTTPADVDRPQEAWDNPPRYCRALHGVDRRGCYERLTSRLKLQQRSLLS